MSEPERSRRNVAASVRARLRSKARAEKLDFNLPLPTVIEDLREFLLPVLTALAAGESFGRQWRAGAG